MKAQSGRGDVSILRASLIIAAVYQALQQRPVLFYVIFAPKPRISGLYRS
jgi:hypothetical protein